MWFNFNDVYFISKRYFIQTGLKTNVILMMKKYAT